MSLDWKKIRREYVYGKTTYKALGEKYGICGSYVARIGAREHWTLDRMEYRIEHWNKVYKMLDQLNANKSILD